MTDLKETISTPKNKVAKAILTLKALSSLYSTVKKPKLSNAGLSVNVRLFTCGIMLHVLLDRSSYMRCGTYVY